MQGSRLWLRECSRGLQSAGPDITVRCGTGFELLSADAGEKILICAWEVGETNDLKYIYPNYNSAHKSITGDLKLCVCGKNHTLKYTTWSSSKSKGIRIIFQAGFKNRKGRRRSNEELCTERLFGEPKIVLLWNPLLEPLFSSKSLVFSRQKQHLNVDGRL